jgi:hypothetical protein
MKPSTLERRRSARVNVSPPAALDVAVSFPAQVLEISASGVLLGCTRELAIGERGVLRATVGAQLLDVAIEIRGVSQEQRLRGGSRYRMGAAFVDLTAEQRVRLVELLGVERN